MICLERVAGTNGLLIVIVGDKMHSAFPVGLGKSYRMIRIMTAANEAKVYIAVSLWHLAE